MKISVIREGVEIGEWSEDQIRIFLREGRLLTTDYYWKEGMTEWKPLAGFIKPPPPTVPAIVPNNNDVPSNNYPSPSNATNLATKPNKWGAPNEELETLYRAAYFQQRTIVFLIFILPTSLLVFGEGAIESSLFVVIPYVLAAYYGLYSYLRYQMALCGVFWGTIVALVSFLIPPLFLINLIRSVRALHKELDDNYLSLDWRGNVIPQS